MIILDPENIEPKGLLLFIGFQKDEKETFRGRT
jgi:hypothetical protein